MTRAELRNIWRTERKRSGISWAEYLKRYQAAQSARKSLAQDIEVET